MDEIKRLPWVTATTGLSRTTLWRLERAGRFPRRVKLSTRAVGWRASDVEAWIAGRCDGAFPLNSARTRSAE